MPKIGNDQDQRRIGEQRGLQLSGRQLRRQLGGDEHDVGITQGRLKAVGERMPVGHLNVRADEPPASCSYLIREYGELHDQPTRFRINTEMMRP